MPEKVDLEALLDGEETAIRKAFRRFVARVKDPEVVSRVVARLRERDVTGALNVMSSYVEQFADELPKAFVRTARAELRNLATQAGSSTDVSFDQNDKTAADLMDGARLDLIQNITDSQREAIQQALADGLRRGEGERQLARTIRSSLGLTANQYKAVDSYRTLLEQGSAEALARELRDKRTDRTMQGAIQRGDILTDSQINRMVDRYEQGMLDYRARMIARTESHRITSKARHEGWRQATDQLDIDPDRVHRTWNAVLDGRERDTHRAMHGQTVVGLDTPFRSPSGALLLYPGDPDAPAAETIQCRCTVTLKMPRGR